MIKTKSFEYKDIDDLINCFKITIKPKMHGNNGKFTDFTKADKEEYAEIISWLKENGYYIEQFPNVINKQSDLQSFAYNEIREYIRNQKNYKITDSIPWADRRELVNDLIIKKKNDNQVFEIDKDLNNKIKQIANGRGSLEQQTEDDQLATLNNCIEYLLKQEKTFIRVDSSIFYNYFENEDIKKYRKDTQIFRHAHHIALEERKKWSKDRKIFYIRLGIIIVTEIYQKILKKQLL